MVGADPVAKLGVKPEALKKTFVIVADIFLTETAAMADVVLPAASLYEKSGTVTNTFGDVQLVRKAADRAGVKPEFEILVRLAGAMGVDVKTSGSRLAMAAYSRPWPIARRASWRGGHACGVAGGQQSGAEAESLRSAGGAGRNCAAGSRIRVDRMNLLSGNDVQTEPGSTPASAICRTGPDYARSRWAVYIRNALATQHGAPGTRAASGGTVGKDSDEVSFCKQ